MPYRGGITAARQPYVAITINKAQDQSAKHVGVDLRVPIFSHGQLYVALSWETSGDNVKVFLPEDQKDARTTNVVYSEVLAEVCGSKFCIRFYLTFPQAM
jgi:hypothetical protein